jgi:bacterioferritin (cytochrome b1)
MRHAEAIAERISSLVGEPTTQPASFKIGKTLKEILQIDKGKKRER